jgi:hypothetical protein
MNRIDPFAAQDFCWAVEAALAKASACPAGRQHIATLKRIAKQARAEIENRPTTEKEAA